MGTRPHDDARDGFEAHTADGHVLRGDVREPPSKRRIGVAILAHAMLARRTEFERPLSGGLARFLVSRGWRTVTFDFRGHGESGDGAAKGASWSYDDLVRFDLPAVVDATRARAKKLPVVVVGHSLGGHVALAAQGTGRIAADAVVCIAANIWLAAHEPSTARWIAKRAVMAGIDAVCRKRGYFPARALRIGSDDEAGGLLRRSVPLGAHRSLGKRRRPRRLPRLPRAHHGACLSARERGRSHKLPPRLRRALPRHVRRRDPLRPHRPRGRRRSAPRSHGDRDDRAGEERVGARRAVDARRDATEELTPAYS